MKESFVFYNVCLQFCWLFCADIISSILPILHFLTEGHRPLIHKCIALLPGGVITSVTYNCCSDCPKVMAASSVL